MKNPIFKTIAVFILGLLVVMVADWANPLFFSDTSIVSEAEAKDKGKEKDKDKDKDKDKVADCDPRVPINRHIGICSNQGTVTVKGMKKYVNVSSGSGAVLADVTSKGVHLTSKSGDLTARGLKNYGIFKSRIGNVRVKYCKKVKKKTGNLFVQISDSAPGVDEDGDPNSSDADLQFTSNSKVKIAIERDPNKFKSDFVSHNNGLVIHGSVTKGNLFISEFNIADPPCKY